MILLVDWYSASENTVLEKEKKKVGVGEKEKKLVDVTALTVIYILLAADWLSPKYTNTCSRMRNFLFARH